MAQEEHGISGAEGNMPNRALRIEQELREYETSRSKMQSYPKYRIFW